MEIRKQKLLKLSTSLAVTIPHGFCKYYNLKPKDRVEVTTGNGKVTIVPIKKGDGNFGEKRIL